MDISAMAFVARLFGLPIAFVIDPFAPLLVFGLSRRAGLIHDPVLLRPEFAGFSNDAFLAVVILMYVAHVIGDKVPPIAHALDAIYLVLKPLAAALVGFWLTNAIDTSRGLHIVTLAVVVLGSITLTAAAHAVRSSVRLAASVGSFGLAIPFLSAAENVLGMLTSALVIFRPEVALIVFVAIGVPSVLVMRAFVRYVRRRIAYLKDRRVSPAIPAGK